MKSSKVSERKFSVVEDTGMEVYDKLEKFIWYLAYTNQDPDNIMMEVDEIVGELMLELAKGLKYYDGLPSEQLLAVLRRMMDNRISELRFRYYVSGRRIPVNMTVSLDIGDSDERDGRGVVGFSNGNGGISHELVSKNDSSPESLVESMERVLEVRHKLTDVSQMVFDAVVFGNNQLSEIMFLSAVRAAAVFKNKSIKIKPQHIADALLMDEKDVRRAFKEIQFAYAEVCCD